MKPMDYYHGLKTVHWSALESLDEDALRALEYMENRGFDAQTLEKCGAKVNYSQSYGLIFPMMDKAKFRNTKAKPYSESQVLKMLDKAYPADNNSGDDDDEPKRKPSKPAKSDDDWGDDDYDAPEEDYSEMSAKELFELCEERGIDAEKRKPQKYYIRLLEEYDNAQDDWGDDDSDDDDWEEE